MTFDNIFGDFQHIKPLVESDIAHSVLPRANDHFLVSYVPSVQASTPFSPQLLAPGTTFTSKTLLVVKSHPSPD